MSEEKKDKEILPLNSINHMIFATKSQIHHADGTTCLANAVAKLRTDGKRSLG